MAKEGDFNLILDSYWCKQRFFLSIFPHDVEYLHDNPDLAWRFNSQDSIKIIQIAYNVEEKLYHLLIWHLYFH